jgi:hypothetical protein
MLLVGANTINVYADIYIMAASMKMLFRLSFALWATVLTVGILMSLAGGLLIWSLFAGKPA